MATSLYILDDDLYFGRCLKKGLESTIDHVKHFKTERNFFRALQSPPDLIILDYHLEKSTGLDVMHELEKRELDSEILLVSAQDKVDVMLKAYKQGALGYFEKHKEILSELEKCIQWILLMSNDFSYPIERNEFRKIWLKQK